MKSIVISKKNGSNLEGKNEVQDSEGSRKDDIEKEDVLVSLENAYDGEAVQKATTSSFCEKREVNFKNKKNLRRHLIKVHVCGNCDDIFYTRTESKVHVHTFHEGDDDNEVKKKAKRNINGKIMMSGENNLHRTGGTTNPNKMWNNIFCKSTKFGAGLLGFLGLLKLEFH